MSPLSRRISPEKLQTTDCLMTKLAPDTGPLTQDSFNPVQKRANLAPTSPKAGCLLSSVCPSIHPPIHQSLAECLQCFRPDASMGHTELNNPSPSKTQCRGRWTQSNSERYGIPTMITVIGNTRGGLTIFQELH